MKTTYLLKSIKLALMTIALVFTPLFIGWLTLSGWIDRLLGVSMSDGSFILAFILSVMTAALGAHSIIQEVIQMYKEFKNKKRWY